ncbi:MAG: putative capsular polysaccharide biosynthesis proteinGlycosyl Transferase Family 2, YveT [Labilithrix sp.]|nr:putative capsular polysaccharide biosynthesis proteinGlycosyl Transferase Family 2, YveT [Labilithrix sp.]
MSAPRVTVGLPFFNEERFLAQAIRSILAQTMGDLELLLVDDGSTDGSLAIARSFADPRVKVLADGERRHLPARLNQITELARGDLVARMDADDVAHPRRLELELAVLAADPSIDAVGAWVALTDDRDHIIGVVEAAPLASTLAAVLERGLIAHPTMLARRGWLLANPYDERLTRAEDRDLWCRTVATSRFAVVPMPLHVMRVSYEDPRFLASYLASLAQNRRLFLRYRSGVGLGTAARLWAAAAMKGLVMQAAVRAGHTETLVKRRGRAPTDRERVLVAEALAASCVPVAHAHAEDHRA